MNISVFIDSIERDKALSRYISHRTARALRRHRRFIERVEVRLRDINGEKGGVDKECKILVVSPRSTPTLVTARHSDAGRAFREALRRLVINLRQALEKAMLRKRKGRNVIRAFKEAA